MTDLELRSCAMHEIAMNDVQYGQHHNTTFNGPAFLNIRAMQMNQQQRPDDSLPVLNKYYNAKHPLGYQLAVHETKEYLMDDMKINETEFNDYLISGIITLVAEDVVEYTLISDTETKIVIGSSDMTGIKDAYNNGITYQGFDVYRRVSEVKR